HTDEELLSLYSSSKDNRWLGILLQRYTVLLLGVGLKYLRDKEQATDAVQQVFLKALVALPDDVQNFKGWLYILMRNHCLQLLRDKRYVHGDDVLRQQQAHLLPDKELLHKQEREIEQMKHAITELDEGQQVCIRMFYLEKKTYQQIMDEKGYSFMQVKSYIQNGKRKLKTILADKK
ncbi:MAG: sigma-70 family RNA polymerase sigma factor, partial [Chitinophagaceae bacterium]|nr:sigma-70 family RNA polymerase sigma factor [Chitinophagaceae bacterium]